MNQRDNLADDPTENGAERLTRALMRSGEARYESQGDAPYDTAACQKTTAHVPHVYEYDGERMKLCPGIPGAARANPHPLYVLEDDGFRLATNAECQERARWPMADDTTGVRIAVALPDGADAGLDANRLADRIDARLERDAEVHDVTLSIQAIKTKVRAAIVAEVARLGTAEVAAARSDGMYLSAACDAGRAFVDAINDFIGSDESPEDAERGMPFVNYRNEVLDAVDFLESRRAAAGAPREQVSAMIFLDHDGTATYRGVLYENLDAAERARAGAPREQGEERNGQPG